MNGLDKLATSNPGIGWGGSHPGLCFDEDVTSSVYDSHDRDSAWIARELGDVPARDVHGHQTMDDSPVSLPWLDELAAIDPGVALAFALLGAGSAPVESLGRDGP